MKRAAGSPTDGTYEGNFKNESRLDERASRVRLERRVLLVHQLAVPPPLRHLVRAHREPVPARRPVLAPRPERLRRRRRVEHNLHGFVARERPSHALCRRRRGALGPALRGGFPLQRVPPRGRERHHGHVPGHREREQRPLGLDVRHVIPRHEQVQFARLEIQILLRGLLVAVVLFVLLLLLLPLLLARFLAYEPAAVALRSKQPVPRAPVVRGATHVSNHAVHARPPAFSDDQTSLFPHPPNRLHRLRLLAPLHVLEEERVDVVGAEPAQAALDVRGEGLAVREVLGADGDEDLLARLGIRTELGESI
mmetsp:Transcript_11482/g.49472  ORF Transcript_11482/g.49472 Transcript_11482/m.49472 type:complete len:309 (-) Transcript_11482:552-1478(-)